MDPKLIAKAEANDRRMLELYSHYVGGRITRGEFLEQVEAFGPMSSAAAMVQDRQPQRHAILADTAAE